jgi:hypothetical protein
MEGCRCSGRVSWKFPMVTPDEPSRACDPTLKPLSEDKPRKDNGPQSGKHALQHGEGLPRVP